jgi:arylsulfatase A-like enzyme
MRGKGIGISAVLSFIVLACAATAMAQAPNKKPNILVIFGDDIGQANISAYTRGLMGYRTPGIDRLAREGMLFTDYTRSRAARPGALRSSPARTSFARA